MTPDLKEHLWSALTSLASAPVAERTITGLAVLLQSNALKQALQPYTVAGPWGRLLDAESERLGEAEVQAFETEGLIGAGAAPAVPSYLFHRIEDRFDGRPTLLIVDEGWLALDDPGFAGQLREWLKTLRKKNASVILATQSLADIDGSAIAPAIIESCPTRILLPNERALEPQIAAIYRRFGLNDRQIEILSRATPKRDYYCQSRRGNRLFELGLSEVALAFTASIQRTEQLLIQAQRIAYSVTIIDQAFTQAYPQSYSASTSSTQLIADAQTRWQNARAAYQELDECPGRRGTKPRQRPRSDQRAGLLQPVRQRRASGRPIRQPAYRPRDAAACRRHRGHRRDGACPKPRRGAQGRGPGAGPATGHELPQLRLGLSVGLGADVPLMRGCLLNIPAIGRALGFAVIAAAVVAAALHFRTSEPGIQGLQLTPRPPPIRLPKSFSAVGRSPQAKDDAACEAAWAENRRRFFTYRPAASATAAPAAASNSPTR